MAVLWYGIIPLTGALVKRYSWHIFRRRFDELRLRPLLTYGGYRQLQGSGGAFRFIGGFESVTDGHTLWIRSENLTMPVSLNGAQTWILPMQESEEIPEGFDPGDEAPERIRWDRVSSFTEGAKVFVGGELVFQDERWSFAPTRETPLEVIFYDGPDRSLTTRAIRAGRQGNEYWNAATPYSLAVGIICQILIAASFLPRPAYRLTVITALVALCTPLFPLIPPGLLCTVTYRRLAWHARIFRAYRDLARLPSRYLARGQESRVLPNGEIYGVKRLGALPPEFAGKNIPVLLPGYANMSAGKDWYMYGAIHPGDPFPVEPEDPFATFGLLPGTPETLGRRYAFAAYTLEAIAWLLILAGIALNVFFIRTILIML